MPPNPFQDGVSVEVSGDSSGLNDALDSAESTLMDFKGAVGIAGAALAGLAAGGLLKATQAASDFEDSMTDVQKVTSGETASELHDQIMALAEDIPIAQSELATLAEQAGKFGAETPEEIMKFVETVAKIQTATDLAADEAGTRFAKIAGAVGLPLSEVDKLANGTNALADSMKTDADEITDTATRASNTLAQQLGLGEDAVLALSASMNEVSPSAELAGSSLRRVGETLMDPKKVGDVADALGMNVDEFRQMRDEDPHGLIKLVAQAMNDNGAAAEQLRGDIGKAATDFSKLGTQLDNTEQAQQTVNEQFEEGSSLEKEMELRTDTLSGQQQILENKLRNVAITIGEQLLPHAVTLIDWISKAVDWFSKLNDKTNGLFGALTLITTLIGGLAVAAGVLVNAMGGVAAIMGGASAAAGALGTAFTLLTGPIGLVVAAIAALAIAWHKNIFGIRDKAQVVIDFLIGAFKKWVGYLKEFVGIVKMALSGDLGGAFNRLKGLVTTIFNDIKSFLLNEAIPRTKSALKTLADGAVNVAKDMASRLVDAVKGFISDAVEFVKGIGKEDVKAAFKALGSGIRTVALAWFNIHKKIGKVLKNFISDVVDYFKNDAKSDVKGAGEDMWDAMKEAAENLKDALTPPDGLIVQLVKDVVSYLKNDAKSDVKAAAEGLWGVIRAAAEGLYEGLIGKSLIPDMFSDIVSYIRHDAASDLASAGKKAASSLANGIKNKFNRVMPDSFEIPQVTIGGGTYAGQKVPELTVGGQDVPIPPLDTGGFIEKGGLARLHEGERVVEAAKVDRDGGGGMNVTVNVDARGASDPDAVGTAVADELRSVLPR